MTTLSLPGLKGSEPIGFLAALGLLRVLSCRGSFGNVRLAWADDAASSAVLHAERECDEGRLIADLLEHMRGRAALPVFAGVMPSGAMIGGKAWDDVKVPLADFATMLRGVRAGGRESADFYAALGTELVKVGNKDAVKPSALHMTSGQQAFLELLRELARSLDADEPDHPDASSAPADAFREAVFARTVEGETGWRAADKFSSMGLDPAREAVYALTATAPTKTGARSTRAAVWLAVEALPLFPVAPIRGRLHTRGFGRRDETTTFRWPLWDRALSVDAVRTAVGVPGIVDDHSPEGLSALGIRAVMESERITIGQGYGQLRPAVRVR